MSKSYLGVTALVTLSLLAIVPNAAIAKGTDDNPAFVIIDQSGSNNDVDANITNDSSNPIPVTVQGNTAKIPFSTQVACQIDANDFSCLVNIPFDEYPTDTNTLEIHYIHTAFTSDPNVFISEAVLFTLVHRFNSNTQFFRMPAILTTPFDPTGSLHQGDLHENLLLFHNGPASALSASCSRAEDIDQGMSCAIGLSGYFIWIDP